MKRLIYSSCFFLLVFNTVSLCKELEDPPPTIGNFAHDLTPGTVFGFGQNIVNKKSLVFYPTLSQLKSEQEKYIAIEPAFIYGITNSLSVYANLPIVPYLVLNNKNDHGIGNLTTQIEYAFYQKNNPELSNQATIVLNAALPTASISGASFASKNLLRTLDALSFFVGATASHLSVHWYTYASLGAIFPTEKSTMLTTTCCKETTKDGSTIYYQGGIGCNLGNPFGLTIMGLIECNGIYSQKDSINGVKQENSGGNIIYLGPSLCICTNRWELQGGIQFPIYQNDTCSGDTQKFRSVINLFIPL